MYAELGSISHGTLNPRGLIPVYLDALDDLKERMSLSARPGEELSTAELVGTLDDLMGEIERRSEDPAYYDSEEALFDLEELTEELHGFAPPYAYFGAQEGDASDFGFWPDWHHIEYARAGRPPELPSGDDVPEAAPEEGEPAEFLHVNDHGNATLYVWNGVAWSVAWSVV